MKRKKIYTTWPCTRDGTTLRNDAYAWRGPHFVVIDVTRGINNAVIVSAPMARGDANAEELRLRAEQEQAA